MQPHWPHDNRAKPKERMTVVFTSDAAPELAGIPATVTRIWPRFPSGDRLVTLEFGRPVQYGTDVITQIDAFLSELEPLGKTAASRPAAISGIASSVCCLQRWCQSTVVATPSNREPK